MIEVKNLVKRFGDRDVIDDLSFTVEKGQIVGFLGPNGAGKSTTMNIITGYISATKGTVIVNGHDVFEEPEEAKKSIGYLPEQPPLYPDMRVREYLDFVADLKKVKKADKNKMMYDIMKMTKITDVSERLIKHLSKGYKQRVGLAGAIMGYPEILILDEPTVGLDPMQIIEIRKLIKQLSEKHTILLSSHIMQEVSAVCNEIMIINQGKLIVKDTPDQIPKHIKQTNDLSMVIKGNKNLIQSMIGKLPEVIKSEVVEADVEGQYKVNITTMIDNDIREQVFYEMAKAECAILEMNTKIPSLEEVFLSLTGEGSKQFGGKKVKAKKRFGKATGEATTEATAEATAETTTEATAETTTEATAETTTEATAETSAEVVEETKKEEE